MGRSYFVPAAGRKACESVSRLGIFQNNGTREPHRCRRVAGVVATGRVSSSSSLSDRLVPRRGRLVFLCTRVADAWPPARQRALPPTTERHREVDLTYGLACEPRCKGGLNSGRHTKAKACCCQCRHHATYPHGDVGEGSNEASMEELP